MTPQPIKAEFKGASGADLAARIELPAGPVEAFAIFAHCFTCSKDVIAARTIATALTKLGFGVMRFDFTGLGGSGGDFGSTNFSMNIGDLEHAANFLREHYTAPSLLIGHSLGGAAVIAAAANIPEIKAVATINAPSNVQRLTGHFGDKVPEIMEQGEAEVTLAERSFRIEKQFLDDLDRHDITQSVHDLKKPLLILHAPLDDVVGIEHATDLFVAARHPKSFISLDHANHLLSDKKDAAYAAEVIAAWASRYLDVAPLAEPEAAEEEGVCIRETAQGKFQSLVSTGPHRLIADEPTSVDGGLGSGPSPYDYLSIALGACTVMTLRMYADHKKIPVERISCCVTHEKTHGKAMKEGEDARPDLFTRHISVEGELEEDVVSRLYEIADKCPVHRTLHAGARVETVPADPATQPKET